MTQCYWFINGDVLITGLVGTGFLGSCRMAKRGLNDGSCSKNTSTLWIMRAIIRVNANTFIRCCVGFSTPRKNSWTMYDSACYFLFVLSDLLVLTVMRLLCFLDCSMMGAITISLGYGIEIKPKNDPNIKVADEAVKGLAGAANFSAFLVNSIPMLKYVPSWMPGAAWKRQAEIWYDWTMKMRNVPFEKSLQQLVSIGSSGSILGD